MDLSREELLVSKIVDNEASSTDWVELELLAKDDPSLWQELAQALRIDSELRGTVDEYLQIADAVEIPVPACERLAGSRVAAVGPALGWAAAFLISLSWMAAASLKAPASPESTESGGLLANSPPGDGALSGEVQAVDSDLRSRYLREGMEQGWLVGELPRLVVETRADPVRQSVEVLYLRRLLERTTVEEFYRTGVDEHGHPASIPVSFSELPRGRAL